MKRRLITTLAIGLSIMVILAGISSRTSGISANNGIPQLINYQGKLTDNEGNPIHNPEPGVSMEFAIYDEDGNLRWEEGPRNVPVTEGLFSVLLGEVVPIPVEVEVEVFDGGSRLLEVTVEGEPLPMKQMVSVGYAFTSERTILDWGKPGVAEDLYEGDTKLTDKYVNVAGDTMAGDLHVDGKITTFGNVGIGTTGPGEKLDVVGAIQSTSGSNLIKMNPGINGTSLTLKNGTTGGKNWVLNSTGNLTGTGAGGGKLLIYSDGGYNHFVLDGNTGNVGIGTTGPDRPLTVERDVNGILARFTNTRTTVGQNFGPIIQAGSGASDYAFQIKKYDSSAPFFIVRGNGNVGIGTTDPAYKLDVAGMIRSRSGGFKFPDGTEQTTAAIGDGHSLDAADGSPTNALFVDNDGNVGIGTTGPDRPLTVERDVNGILARFTNTRTTVGQNFGPIIQAGSGASDYAFQIKKYDSSAPFFIVRGNGNVGIGTTEPAYKLDVAGMIRSSDGGFVFPDGTKQTTAATGGDGDITSVWPEDDNSLAGGGDVGDVKLRVANGGITTIKIDNNAVNSSKIQDGEVTGTDIANETVTGTNIKNGTVAEADIANNAINNAKIQDGTVTGADIANGTISGSDIGKPLSLDGGSTNGLIARSSGGNTPAIWGENTANIGVYGKGGNGMYAEGNIGISAFGANAVSASGTASGEHPAIWANSYGQNDNNWGIYAVGMIGCSGPKPTVIETSAGTEPLYAIEAPDVEFYTSGTANLVKGESQVTFGRLFVEAISPAVPIKVIVTPTGECNGLYVASKSQDGFVVRELAKGTSNVSFDWIAIGRRKGYETRPSIQTPQKMQELSGVKE